MDAHSLVALDAGAGLPPTETAVVGAAHLGAVRLIDKIAVHRLGAQGRLVGMRREQPVADLLRRPAQAHLRANQR